MNRRQVILALAGAAVAPVPQCPVNTHLKTQNLAMLTKDKWIMFGNPRGPSWIQDRYLGCVPPGSLITIQPWDNAPINWDKVASLDKPSTLAE